MSDVSSVFKKHFGAPPVHVARAPGRLELLGNHTDYNAGLVVSVAVNRYIHMAASPRNDGKISLVSDSFPQVETFNMNEIRRNAAFPWTDYVKGVLQQLCKRGVHFTGFNAAVSGDIPMGAGMSSSAALEVAAALTVRKLFPYHLRHGSLGTPPARDARGALPPPAHAERLELAKLCRAAENEFVGVQCGILDQVSSLFGKVGNVIELDCKELTVERAPLAGGAIIVCNSGVKHELVGGEYNELRQNCEAAAQKLHAKYLRTVEPRQVLAAKERLTEREFQCAYHVTTEIARVAAGARVLRDGDHAQFGQFMFQSHESSRDNLHNSTEELDILVELARQQKGCYGARLTGGGFGGATINLVAYHEAERFMSAMAAAYHDRTGVNMRPIVCQIADGAE